MDNNEFSFVRKKTENKARGANKIFITLTDELKEIIERQGSRKIGNDYVFNVIPSNANEAELIRKVKIIVVSVNVSLKKMANKLGITESISTYFARHSYANNLMNNNAPTAFISQKLGHSNQKTTENYLGGFTTNKAAEYESNLLDKSKIA